MYNVEMTFYRTGKQAWSTYIPEYSNTDTKVLGEIFEPYDILSPTIIINNEAMTYPEGHIPYTINEYNYVYIDTLDRYYWIKDWVRQDGLWYGYCAEDYLATFRDDILKTKQYVLRSSVIVNKYIPDNMYGIDYNKLVTKYVAMGQDVNDRHKWQGKIDNVNNKVKQLNQFRLFIKCKPCGYNPYKANSLNNTDTTKTYTNDMTTLLVTDVNNMDYITSVLTNQDKSKTNVSDFIQEIYYLPVQPIISPTSVPTDVTGHYGEERAAKIVFGNITSAKTKPENDGGDDWISIWFGRYGKVSYAEFIKNNAVAEVNWSCDIPSTSMGYLSTNQYRKLSVQINPFGTIPLDSDIYINRSYIKLKCYVDFFTGEAILQEDYTGNGDYRNIAATNVKIPVQLTSTIHNSAEHNRSVVQSIISTAGTMVAGAVAGPVGMAAVGALSTSGISVGNNGMRTNQYMQGPMPPTQAETNISNLQKGTFINGMGSVMTMPPVKYGMQLSGTQSSGLFDDVPILFVEQYNTVLKDEDRFGTPICASIPLKELTGGYVQCQNSKFGGSGIGNRALLSERQAIEQALDGGVYLV